MIRRALAEVATPATRTDGDVGDDAVAAPDATHILAFAEEEDEEVPEDDEKGEKDTEVGTKEDAALVRVGSRTVGYSFLDAAAGSIHLGVLPPDDEHGTALATLLAQVSPAEVLVRRGRVSDVARRELVKCAAKLESPRSSPARNSPWARPPRIALWGGHRVLPRVLPRVHRRRGGGRRARRSPARAQSLARAPPPWSRTSRD